MHPMDGATSVLLQLAAGAALIVLVYYLLFGRRADFVIHVRGGQVRCRGKVALAVRQRLAHFLLDDLGVKGSVRILGAYQGKRVQVWFRGPLSPGEQQRIRNFLALGG
jgi:hypothetical protein